MSKTVKRTIIIAVVIIVALFAYRFFFVRVDEEALVSTEVEANEVGREVLLLLNQLRAIELNGEIFERSDFRSLVDFGVEIQSDPVGRRNPFAPLGVSNFESSVPESNLEEENLPAEEDEEEENLTPTSTPNSEDTPQ